MDKINPAYINTDKIKFMENGQAGYTLPWALYIMADGACYLNGNYPCEAVPGGTLSMPIRKDKRGNMIVTLDFDYFGGRYKDFDYSKHLPHDAVKVDKLIQ